MLKERNQSSRNTHHLLGADVHVRDIGGARADELTFVANNQAVILTGNFAVLDIGIRRSNENLLGRFLIGSQLNHIIGEQTVLDKSVRRSEEPVLIHTRVNRKVGNKSDVRTFGGFNRTNTSVVGDVNISHIETGTLTIQAAWPEGREAPFVRQLR